MPGWADFYWAEIILVGVQFGHHDIMLREHRSRWCYSRMAKLNSFLIEQGSFLICCS
jgi:hypothetical protein